MELEKKNSRSFKSFVEICDPQSAGVPINPFSNEGRLYAYVKYQGSVLTLPYPFVDPPWILQIAKPISGTIVTLECFGHRTSKKGYLTINGNYMNGGSWGTVPGNPCLSYSIGVKK